jgi:hypothetical protein
VARVKLVELRPSNCVSCRFSHPHTASRTLPAITSLSGEREESIERQLALSPAHDQALQQLTQTRGLPALRDGGVLCQTAKLEVWHPGNRTKPLRSVASGRWQNRTAANAKGWPPVRRATELRSSLGLRPSPRARYAGRETIDRSQALRTRRTKKHSPC